MAPVGVRGAAADVGSARGVFAGRCRGSADAGGFCRVRVQGGQLVVVSSPAVNRLLGLLGLADRFTFVPTAARVGNAAVNVGRTRQGM